MIKLLSPRRILYFKFMACSIIFWKESKAPSIAISSCWRAEWNDCHLAMIIFYFDSVGGSFALERNAVTIAFETLLPASRILSLKDVFRPSFVDWFEDVFFETTT